jgi:hypothetical protein
MKSTVILRKPTAAELTNLLSARKIRLCEVPAANALETLADILDVKRYGERLYVLSVSN